MKKLLVLAAGLLQIPVIKKARELGYFVIAADGASSAPGLREANKAIVIDITSENLMLDLARKWEIDGVIHPCSEVSMNVMGRINDELHLHGINLRTAICATNKHLMRQSFEAFGAPSPRSYCTDLESEGWHLFASLGGKAILKPSRNSGSRGIAEIEPDVDRASFACLFERAKKESRDNSVMIEQFVEGPEFSVEIIVWNGTVNVLQVTDKKTTEAPYFVELGHNQPSLFPASVVDAVKDAAVRGVKALGLNDCAAHAEVKVQGEKAYLMEIGARLGGDFISTELTHLSSGIDMVAAAINVALGVEPDLAPKSAPQGVAIRYFTPIPGRVVAIENEQALNRPDVYDYDIYVKPGDEVREVKSSLDRSGHVIVTAPNASAAIALAEDLISSVKIVTE